MSLQSFVCLQCLLTKSCRALDNHFVELLDTFERMETKAVASDQNFAEKFSEMVIMMMSKKQKG